MQDLEAERETFKKKWIEDTGSDWDDDKVYPSCSDSSISESSEDESPPVRTIKKEHKCAEGTGDSAGSAWTVGAPCMAKYNDGKFHLAEVVKIEPSGIAVSFTEHENEVQMRLAQDLKAIAETPPAKADPSASAFSFKQNAGTSLHSLHPDSNGVLPSRGVLRPSTLINSNPDSEDRTMEELNRLPISNREEARTIIHLINDLHRKLGKKDSVLTALLRNSAEEVLCDFVTQLLAPKPAVVYRPPEIPNLIQDDGDNTSDSIAERPRRSRRCAGAGARTSKAVGWSDDDSETFPCVSNPKNWPAEEEFSSSILLNQGTDCISKALAMEFRMRKPLEHLEIRTITDPQDPCYGARGVFAKTTIPKDRIVCPYMGLYRQQTESNSHFIFNLDFDIPGKGAPKKIKLDIDSRGSCIGNESKFINDGICLDCIRKIQAGENEAAPANKPRARGGTRWINCSKCRESNVMGRNRISSLLGIPYIAIIATRQINKGEELLLNYGEGYWQAMQPHEVNAEGQKAATDCNSTSVIPSCKPFVPAARRPSNAGSALNNPARVAASVAASTFERSLIVPEN
jgi:hypothetical protein